MRPSPARWWAGWRVALRMARRDVRRHRGRSALVLVMVAVPVAVLVGGLSFVSTSTPDDAALLPRTLGSAVADLTGPDAAAVLAQSADGGATISAGDEARPVPGFAAATTPADQTASLARLTGGTLVPARDTSVVVSRPQGGVTLVDALLTDPRELGSKARLLDGRWPERSDEVSVTPGGQAEGLPSRGALEVRVGEGTRTLRVVGLAEAFDSRGQAVDLVSPDLELAQGEPTRWLLLRGSPVEAAEIRTLNEYGLTVRSAAALQDPDEGQFLAAPTNEVRAGTAIGLGVVLVAVVTLLVGPAFAVSAARQRRSLALVATLGAERSAVRRVVLAQGVVLGLLATTAGTGLGVLGGLLATRIRALLNPDALLAFTVPTLPVLVIASAGLLACVTAALLPSRGLGRLDVLTSVRRAPRPSPRWVLVLGLACCLVGGAALLLGSRMMQDVAASAGGVVLAAGALLATPALLQAVGRLAARLPLAARFAARDAARHRARALPTVAALMTAGAVLTVTAVWVDSESATGERDYTPQAVPGEGQAWTTVENAEGELEALAVTLTSRVPEVDSTLDRVAVVDHITQGGRPGERAAVLSVPEGCTVAEAEIVAAGGRSSQPCPGAGQILGGRQIAVWPAEEIVRRLDLGDTEAAAVRAGAGVMDPDDPVPATTIPLVDARWVDTEDSVGSDEGSVVSRVDLPVVGSSIVGRDVMSGQEPRLVVPLEVARQQGWPLSASGLTLFAADRPLTSAEEEEIAAWAPGASYVERGWQDPSAGFAWILYPVAGVLLLLVTLTATALAVAEQQEDQGTLAAVGATRGTRRALAAAQAAVTGLLGGVLGAGIGLVIGVAVVRGLSAQDELTQARVLRDMIVVIPGLPLAAVVLGVPLLAAGLAALAIRREPRVTRRLG